MKFLAVFLSLSLAGQAMAQHTMVSPQLGDTSAPWITSGTYWRRTFSRPDTTVRLREPVKLRDFVVDGKLELSLRSYLDLVLANNTDVDIQRLSLEQPKNAIQRAFGVFDPLVFSSFTATRTNQPTSNALEGALVLSNLNQPFNLRYQQTLSTGTQFFSTLAWTKASTNNTFQLFNPNYQNTWQSGFTQPLLRNAGTYINKLPITIARGQKVSADLRFEDSLQRLLVTAENAFWDVIAARERIKVQEQALELARQSLDRAKKEIELGATSPLEIYQPEQNYATARIGLTQVQYQLIQAEDVLRRQIGADLDPEIRKMPIVLTEKVEPNLDETPFDRESIVNVALSKRPDLRAERNDVNVADLQIDSARNLLKPVVNLNGWYQSFGRGGTAYLGGAGGGTPIVIPGGPGDAWGQMFGFDYNSFNGGITFNFPLRDRAATANYADSVVNKRLQALQVRQVEQQVRQDVLNAITQVENSRASVNLAKIAVDYAIKRAEADQKRYDLGVINLFFLLSAQQDLTNAQSNLVNQTVQFRRNLLNLQQRAGTLLEEKGIVIQ